MRLAAIDIGTNSVHMIVARVRPDFSFEIIDREKEMVRLGAGGLDGRRLTPEAMTSALQALSKFERLARSHAVDEILAVATSATREADNGGAFLADIERQIGVLPRVISGTEEARLIHLAAAYGVDTPRATVVIDIGGGSVEITLGTGSAVRYARSFKLGVIRLSERFATTDPLTRRDERKLVRHVGEQVDAYLQHIVTAGFDRVIGTSGTILSIGTLATTLDRGAPPGEVRNLRVPARSIRRVRRTVTALDLEERLALPGLEPRRADLIVSGAVLLDSLLRRLGARDITLCDLALREGLILDYIQRNRRQIAQVDRYPDVRRRSAIELAERCNWDSDHAARVAALALSLFDQTRGIHGLTDREREWLEYAALLHDVGMNISFERHHRHSYYLIKNGGLRGFEPDEIEVMALVARYHRRATPKRAHEGYGDLPAPRRRVVRTLGACLRMAESLDRSRAGAVHRVDVRTNGVEAVLRLEAAGDVELEAWAAQRQRAPLEAVLGMPLRLEVTRLDGRPPARAARSADAARARGRR
jgi:exopolyphosphatase / guanosine-5'-triphosphate,3'-diphosphate pyrophosphatase